MKPPAKRLSGPDSRPTVSRVASIFFCERKAVFDSVFGEIKTPETLRQAELGEAEHARFEREGAAAIERASRDERCFIATAVFGAGAPETRSLRDFRDRALMPSPAGRLFVRTYYALSPLIVPALRKHAGLAAAVRVILRAAVRLADEAGRG
ncbi:CFI-box-CTERM domain-containing protein [Methylococcus capsulatus]|jgi:hypothetical protein|uniref:CFI-box-CTERM domain-containing protein n=1 Tax=Methylococcus capsulatus TaxID=414 RepID=UPI001C52CB22|nr:CFI-box-CTERM domain-containing protein [Methylococcus capsulatus]QXP89497.1 hypothetical protein KW114_10275 [Methylococcus capsulatus]